MAKPDCDDGWYRKSIELDAALGYSDFTKIAQTLLRYVFCQIFGQGSRPKYAILNCSEIASRMKKPRQHIHRAIQELIASNVLAPVKGHVDTYRFVKDYEKWVLVARLKGSFYPTNRPRLTPEEVADCMDAPEYSRGFIVKKHTDESVINRDDKTEEPNGTLSSIEMTNCHQSRLQTVINRDDKTASPYVPPIRKEIESVEAAAADAREPKRPQTLDQLHAWVVEYIDESQDVGTKLRGWVASYGVSDTFDALMKAWINKPEGVSQYAHGTLQGWHARDQLPSKQPKATPVPFQAVPPNGTDPLSPRAAYPVRQTKAEKNAEINAARRASMAKLYPPKDSSNGSG